MSNSLLPIRKFPCPGCGADLDFDPSIGQLKCPYCSREEAIPQTAEEIQSHSYEEYFSGQRTRLSRLAATAVELDCPDCGAGLVFEPPDVAGRCPFCAANLAVAQTRLASPTLSPEGIVPFQCDRATARKQLQKWLKGRWLAPFGFSQLVQPDKMEGVYLPFWAYDFQTTTHYDGERGTYYYRNNERRTRWNNVSGIVNCSFQEVLVSATTALSAPRLQALRPWKKDAHGSAVNPSSPTLIKLSENVKVYHFSQPGPGDPKQIAPPWGKRKQSGEELQADLCAYSSAYLAGFKAQRYQMSLKDGFELAQDKVKKSIERAVCQDIGGDRQKIEQLSMAHSAITYKLVLLPVWLCAYRYRGKQYQVAINGCTQKLQGDYPISHLKRWALILLGAAISLPILLLFLPILLSSFPLLIFAVLGIVDLIQRSRKQHR